jgi:hypothetical protein
MCCTLRSARFANSVAIPLTAEVACISAYAEAPCDDGPDARPVRLVAEKIPYRRDSSLRAHSGRAGHSHRHVRLAARPEPHTQQILAARQP